MFRLVTSFAVLMAALGTPVIAADWADEWGPEEGFRGSYSSEPRDWSGLGDPDDSVGFEFGSRYWYSWGAQNFTLDGEEFSTRDNAHAGELHLRIDDYASRSYVKGVAGYSAAINGTYSDPVESSGEIVDGTIGYAGADFGWNAFGDGAGSGVGFLAGYHYWHDSPRTSRANYTTAGAYDDISWSEDTGIWSVGFDSKHNFLDVHALRVGFSGKAKLGEHFDISGEIAAIPLAGISGTIGSHASVTGLPPYPGCDIVPPGSCPPLVIKSSETAVSGWGYGGMAELMAGIHPTENLTFRFGGRAWYVEGTYDAKWRQSTIYAPQRQPQVLNEATPDPDDMMDPDPLYGPPSIGVQNVTSDQNPFSLFRYGLLAELTYSF